MPPQGWEVTPLPDGTVLLRRAGVRRLMRDASWGWALVLGAGLFFSLFTNTRRLRGDGAAGTQAPWLAYGPAALLLLAGIVALVAAFCAREELRTGPRFLERRWRLWAWERTYRLEGEFGFLRVDTETHLHARNAGQYTRRALRAEVGPRRRTIDARNHEHGWLGIGLGPNLAGFGDDVAQLGRFLAAQTGWTFSDPASGTIDMSSLL
jgi:hypothetical protein